MLIIAHRGNLNGKSKNENDPVHIAKCLELKLDVEIDCHFYNDELWIGHDQPQYRCPMQFLASKKIWFHAKDLHTLDFLLDLNLHVFWHQKDNYTITSKGFIWAYPGQKVSSYRCIYISQNMQDIPPTCYGICTDHPLLVNKIFNE